MKKTLAVCFCLVLLCGGLFSACNNDRKAEIKFADNKALGYEWRIVASRDGIVEIKESYEEGKKDKAGYAVYKITAIGEGEVTLDFSYVNPIDNDLSCAATYVFSVDKNLKLTEKFHEGSYFD